MLIHHLLTPSSTFLSTSLSARKEIQKTKKGHWKRYNSSIKSIIYHQLLERSTWRIPIIFSPKQLGRRLGAKPKRTSQAKSKEIVFFSFVPTLPKGPPLIDAPNYPFKRTAGRFGLYFFFGQKPAALPLSQHYDHHRKKKIPPSCAARNIPTLPFLVSHFHLETDAINTSWFLLFPLTLALLRIDHQVLSATK